MALDDDAYGERTRAPKQGGSGCLYWTLGCGAVGVIGVLLCCGGFAMLGLNMISTEAEVALRDNAEIREHLGELTSVKMNMTKTMTHAGDDLWVYDLVGTKGKGELTAHQTTDGAGDEVFHTATLRLSDGQTIEIDMKSKAAAEPDIPFDAAEPVTPPVTTPSDTATPATDPAP
ncbi:MAG TPA: hypothetical protein VFG20_19520 [Planctomycetaceae bacterium]|nr:hypothetical protein [Planctomycetaceae bacterium]